MQVHNLPLKWLSKENVFIIGELPAKKSYVGTNRKYMRLKVEIDANEPP